MYTVAWMSNSRAYFTAATMINCNSTGIKVFKSVSYALVEIILLRTPLLFSLGFNNSIYNRRLTGINFSKRRHWSCFAAIPIMLCTFSLCFNQWGCFCFLFAGFYFWIATVTGIVIIEELGQIHFWGNIYWS